MTPSILTQRQVNPNTAYELSRGEGFQNEPIYGVTVIRKDGNDWANDYDAGKMFKTMGDAQDYISQL